MWCERQGKHVGNFCNPSQTCSTAVTGPPSGGTRPEILLRIWWRIGVKEPKSWFTSGPGAQLPISGTKCQFVVLFHALFQHFFEGRDQGWGDKDLWMFIYENVLFWTLLVFLHTGNKQQVQSVTSKRAWSYFTQIWRKWEFGKTCCEWMLRYTFCSNKSLCFLVLCFIV
jgi:hypothetical protein